MNRIEKIQQYLAKSPADSFLQHALALEYIKIGDDAGAERLFKEILQRDPAYIGSYYHLGKLLERTGSTDEAIQWYEKGMEVAKKAGDTHAYNELRGAADELL
jgi:Tfp pilus assembly protein PilF